eukprot:m.149264 g.149264  ORF g.149264 m.149264 type:complete len:240 (-) comp17809_c0_seq2:396-1115(-)
MGEKLRIKASSSWMKRWPGCRFAKPFTQTADTALSTYLRQLLLVCCCHFRLDPRSITQELLALNADATRTDVYGSTPIAAAGVLGSTGTAEGGGALSGWNRGTPDEKTHQQSVRRWKQSQLRFPGLSQPFARRLPSTVADKAPKASDDWAIAKDANPSVVHPPSVAAVFHCFTLRCDEHLFRGTWLERLCFNRVQTMLLCLQRLCRTTPHTRPVPLEIILLILRQMTGLHFYDRRQLLG